VATRVALKGDIGGEKLAHHHSPHDDATVQKESGGYSMGETRKNRCTSRGTVGRGCGGEATFAQKTPGAAVLRPVN